MLIWCICRYASYFSKPNINILRFDIIKIKCPHFVKQNVSLRSKLYMSIIWIFLVLICLVRRHWLVDIFSPFSLKNVQHFINEKVKMFFSIFWSWFSTHFFPLHCTHSECNSKEIQIELVHHQGTKFLGQKKCWVLWIKSGHAF